MVEPQLPNEHLGEEFVGLGWFCSGEANDFCIGHAGENERFVADLSLLPRKGDGLVIMTNALSAWPLIEQLKLQAGSGA